MKNTIYYPIEILHWAGMTDACLSDFIQICIAQPDLIHSLNAYQDNALMIACRIGNIKIVQYIIENTNIDIQHENYEGNALMIACKYKHQSIAQYLIENTKISIYTKDQHHNNLFHIIAQNGLDTIFELILQKKKRIFLFQKNQENKTPFHTLIDFYMFHKNYYLYELFLLKLQKKHLQLFYIHQKNILDYMYDLLEQKPLEYAYLKSLIFLMKNKLHFI